MKSLWNAEFESKNRPFGKYTFCLIALLLAVLFIFSINTSDVSATSGTDDDGIWTYYFDDSSSVSEIISYHGTDPNPVIPNYFYDPSCVVKTIRDDAFRNNSLIQTVTIPSTVTSIGNSAFRDCTALESMVVPDTVTSLGTNMFDGCISLTVLTTPYVTDYFCNGCTLLETVTHTVGTSIGQYAFYNCISLESITRSSNVSLVGDYAFYCCSNLIEFDVSIVQTVGKYAFYKCTNLSNQLYFDFFDYDYIYLRSSDSEFYKTIGTNPNYRYVSYDYVCSYMSYDGNYKYYRISLSEIPTLSREFGSL